MEAAVNSDYVTIDSVNLGLHFESHMIFYSRILFVVDFIMAFSLFQCEHITDSELA